MKSKKTSKATFFVVLVLILALTFTAFFGISGYYGDIRQVYIKGAQDIRWGIDISGGVEAVFSPDKKVDEITSADMESAKTIIEKRLVADNVTDYEVYADSINKQIIVRFPWTANETSFDPLAAIKKLGKTAVLSFCANTDKSTVILSGSADIASASVGVLTETNQYVVNLKFTDSGMSKFKAATGKYSQISIWMDDEMISAPSVKEQITTNNAYIEGNFTAETAQDLANQINAGSLPFALTVDESKLQVISPTLGANALNVMVIAGAIAFALVCLLMILRYRLPGVIASFALLGQLAGMIACISGYFGGLESFTLTIPGIAGIILSIGVGVDANVIASERIREEFQNGKTIDGAIAAGFENSFNAVLDGNVTIVIIAAVLMGAFGNPDSLLAKIFSPIMALLGSSITGSIYSFGYTLFVGVVFNLIMGIYASKFMMKSISRYKVFRKPWLFGGAKNNDKFNIDFNKTLKWAAIIYAAVIVVGIVLTCIFGVKLDINFSGGTRLSYSYTGDLSVSKVDATVDKALGTDAAVSLNTSMNGSTKQVVITLPGNNALSTEKQSALTTALTTDFKSNNIKSYDSNSVSPTIAGTFFAKSIVAILIAGIFVVIYVGFRFRNIGGISAALTAFVALILDCIVAFLACTAFRLPVDSNLIAVILTLLGYSLNDTIVIYDRVRENRKLYPSKDTSELVNESVNSVMIRTIVTTVTTVLAVATIIVVAEIFGLTTLRSFAIPMVFGLLSGSISSIFISGPLWVKWKNYVATRPVKVKKSKKK